jgi:mannose-6-phosphate isomerase-like protein (cupin superfamily)
LTGDDGEALSGLVIPPGGGEVFEYCARPVTLNLKVDSVTAPGTDLVAGTGEIRGDEGIGRHREDHEVIYIRDGWGFGVFGADTVRLAPGSVVYVPPGTPHRLVSTGPAPMDYFWVMGPRSSGEGFRQAAAMGCDDDEVQTPSSGVTLDPAFPDVPFGGALIVPPESGERITYCAFPLTITFKIDGESVDGTPLIAARGALRRGSEIGRHSVDEVVLITHGEGLGFVGRDTVAVEPGSVVFTPRGAEHGFINEGKGTLEYLVIYGPYDSPQLRTGFRRLADSPGPWCPDNLG